MKNRIYAAIDLKSFYASVECVERGLDPMKTNLVVADSARTEKTICLAVTPSLKAYGVSGRARLFEVVERVKEINASRRQGCGASGFSGSSFDSDELVRDPTLRLDYIVAPPRMAKYMEYSTNIYNIYLRYVAPEDIHVYSVDEVFIDLTDYLKFYGIGASALTRKIILDVLHTTGITATAGIGTNMYLAKVALDIEAKRISADEYGVRIAELDERGYKETLWSHRPITDFWRVGRGYAKKLEAHGLYTMGDVARCSISHEDLLYDWFGINAELLIDHAWGYESCTIADIKSYKPSTNSISSGQVLKYPYSYEKAMLIVREMTELLALELVEKRLVTDKVVLTIGYDVENLKGDSYMGERKKDRYNRTVPKDGHGTEGIGHHTSSSKEIMDVVMRLFERITDKRLYVRRVTLCVNNVIEEREATVKDEEYTQLDFFTDYDALRSEEQKRSESLAKERRMQEAVISIKKKHGKNAIVKGMNLEEGATTIERNSHIGGHKA